MNMTGKVWLVGAGPGDTGLFTIKGKQVLEQAQVVVYDSLVGDGVLAMVPKTARLIHVGKRAGHHTMKQEMINQVLLEEAQKGYRVVRLKGGDPFLFGRGGEELELLSEHGVPYEVVPGVTSCIAVPAYNGIPVTHRDYCSSVHVITGHKRAGHDPKDSRMGIDFEALVRTGGTLVFLMGVTALEDICRNLLEAGMSPSTPAAILQQGTTAGQKKIVATVATLKEEVDRQGIETPAIIVVGQVCQTAERFSWYEKLPLFGCKVLVTRPKELISSMAAKLRKEGAEVLELPAIAVNPVNDRKKLRECLRKLETYQWIAFTSPSGVRIFFELLLEEGKDIRSLGNVKIAAIGGGTGKALKRQGICADLIPEIFDGASLGKKMAEVCEPDASILLPRAAIGNHEIIEELTKRPDLKVDDIAVYDTVYEQQELIDVAGEFEKGRVFCAVFTSASTVRGFVQATPGLNYTKVRAACIGPQTQAAAESYGMCTQVAAEASIDSVIELVIQWNRNNKR